MEIRALFIKALVDTEFYFERLTNEEQIELINKLIRDHNISFPNDKKDLIILNHNENDEYLNW